ncbi:unnamed protein product [Urochloa decumbens]|uniref:Uncharacterized protein n=1 Tax=Urochloa decumbens TaxID=240449 RepID=A0ABC9C0X3_9POAL
MGMGVVVRKSPPMVVRPSEPPPTTTASSGTIIKLSSFDKPCTTLPVTSFLVFEHPIHEAAETVKKALSQALVYYYPIAGRIVAGPGGGDDLHIQCNGEGVTFVAASASHALKDVEFFARSSSPGSARKTTTTTTLLLLDELAVYYPAERCGGPADPLLLMQVTEFSCGGFVLGATWNHGLADGAGMAQFLQAVGELARGSSQPSLVPVRSSDDLPPRPDISRRPTKKSEPLDLACLDIAVPVRVMSARKQRLIYRDDVCKIKDDTGDTMFVNEVQPKPTSPGHDYGRSSPIPQHRPLRGPGNTPPPPCEPVAMDGYYGNCVTMRVVTAAARTVANAGIMDLVEMIRRAKNGVVHDDQQTKDNGSDLDEEEQVRYNTLTLSSWRNIGFEKADFGGGTPERVMCRLQPSVLAGPSCVVNLPCVTEKDGGLGSSNVFAACVKEEHAGAFLGEIASLISFK